MNGSTITYKAKTKHCYRCGRELPEITCAKGTNRFRCGSEACMAPLGADRVACWHCGVDLGYRLPTPNGIHYCFKHHAAERRLETEGIDCGDFMGLFGIYRGWAATHYRDTKAPLQELRKFFKFLNSEGISDIRSVDFKTVSKYCTAVRTGKKLNGEPPVHTPYHATSKPKEPKPRLCRADFLKVFFEFLKLRGIYANHDNPVQPEHFEQDRRSAPRFYSEKERERLWKWLEERGDTRAKLIVALVEEAGLMPYAICALRVGDIDPEQRTIKLRRCNPKHGESEFFPHPGFYHDKTRQYLLAWESERPQWNHPFLLTNTRGGPLQVRTLWEMLNNIFLRRSKFRSYKEGLEKFELERLRNGLIRRLRKKMSDEAVMRMMGILARRTIERFDRDPDRKQVDRARTKAKGRRGVSRPVH